MGDFRDASSILILVEKLVLIRCKARRNFERLILIFNGNYEIIFHQQNEITVYQKLLFIRYDMLKNVQLLFSPSEFQLLVTSRSCACNRCHGGFGLTSRQTQTGNHGCGYHGENSKDRWYGYTGWKVVNHKRVFENFKVKTA